MTARPCGTVHPDGTACPVCDAAWLAPYPGEGHAPTCHPMPCCGRMDCEPHTADCPDALAQDIADGYEEPEA